jgi:glutathione S-transferase
MLKILGRASSINVQKVMWLTAELGLEVERVDIGGPFGGNDQPDYLAKNPMGRVPTLEDGDLVIFESHSIVRHIAEAYGGDPWYPADPHQRAVASQWMDWTLAHLHPHMTVIYKGLVRTPPEERDVDAIEDARRQAADMLAILDRRLAGSPYLTGDDPNMGDIALGAYAYRWFNLELERPAADNLRAWYDRIAARPAFRDHVMLPLS